MKKITVITRAAIVSGLLAAVAVPAANAYSENANLGSSVGVRQDGGASANSNGVGRPDYWGGCRGVHGDANPGQGNGPVGGFNGQGNGPDKSCESSGVAGATVPETR